MSKHSGIRTLHLLDDTLIVGTTIAKTEDFLTTEIGARVTVHIFCVDTAWQVDAIVRPDTVFLRADDRTVMNFCASLVRAMSLLPRPYLVDFPLLSLFELGPVTYNASYRQPRGEVSVSHRLCK